MQADGTVVARVRSSEDARVLDISPFGVQVELRTALRPGSTCEVSVPVVDGELRMQAVVRRCRVAALTDEPADRSGVSMVYRAGLEFVRCSQQEAERIRAAYGGRDEPPPSEPRRTGPIRIRVDPDTIGRGRGGG